MGCKDNFCDKFISMDVELLEDVEPPYLISLSDSQVSSHDIQSDCHSSDTLEVSSSSENKVKGRFYYPENEKLFEEKHLSADYEDDVTFKPPMDSFASGFKMQELKFNDRGSKNFCCCFHKDRITNSVSSLNLSTYGIDCICEASKKHTSIHECGRNGLSKSKRCVSLPTLNFIPEHKMMYTLRRVLQNIPHIYKHSEDSFMKIALLVANTYSFGNILIKTLLEKVHSLQLAIKEKDTLISELMYSYDKLIMKHAEAENKIDRMRFDNSISEGHSKSSLNYNAQSKIDTNSIASQEMVNDFLGAGLHKKHKALKDRNDIFPEVNAQKRIRKLESCRNKCNHKQREALYGGTGLDVKTSDKEIADSQHNKDNFLLHSDLDFHICEVDNKINIEIVEKDILRPECTTYRKNDVFSDHDSFSHSEDESLRSLRNHEILRTANPLHSKKSLKNNFNNSYNKIITYAKTKRELASYPDFHNLMYERNENDSHESLLNLDIQKVEETFIKSTKEKSTIMLSQNKNIEVNDAQSIDIENVGLTDSKLESISTDYISATHPQALLDNDNSCQTENDSFPENPSGLLNNVLVQGKNALKREEKLMSKYFYSRIPDSNFKISLLEFKETNPVDNKIQMDVTNNFEGISTDDIALLKKQLIFSKMEESDSSASLGSVKLEACDCWNDLPSSQIIRSYKQDTLSIESEIAISPLLLDLSSSDDYSSPIIGTDNQESDERLKSLDDAAIDDGKVKEMSQLEMNAKFGIPLGDSSRKIVESMQIAASTDNSQKKISQIMNTLNKIDKAASELKSKTEGLKNYLALQLDNLSLSNVRRRSKT